MSTPHDHHDREVLAPRKDAPHTLTRTIIALTLAAAMLGTTACASTGPGTAPSSPASKATSASSAAPLTGSITVFAAASLTSTFTEIASRFEEENPGTTIGLAFAGSSDLVTQIANGAPADVFASADEKSMGRLADEGLLDGRPVDFASNVLEIAVPPSNPESIAVFADLARDGVATVICAMQVPCGAATSTIEEKTGIELTPVSEESSVTDVLGKVTSGEADAGLVYVTDVAAAGGRVLGIPFPESSEAVNVYPIAPISSSTNPGLAAAFAAYVTSESSWEVLAAAGFGRP